MKKTIAICLLGILTGAIYAQSEPNRWQSAKEFKTGARNATTGVEAAFYNPAGTVFNPRDGFTLEFSYMPFFGEQSVTDTRFPGETFVGEISAPIFPGLNFTYKKDKWAIVGNVGIQNGGGTGNFEEGAPALVAPAQTIAGALGIANPDIMTSANAGSRGFGANFSFAYRFADWISASAGVHLMGQADFSETELRITDPSTGQIAFDAPGHSEATGFGMGYVFGLNVKPTEKLLIANTFRYFPEFEAEVGVVDGKNFDLQQFGGPQIIDGEPDYVTYTPYYSFGISYQINPQWRIEGNMDVALYSMVPGEGIGTESSGSSIDEEFKDAIDFGLGVEYQVSDPLNIGFGFMISEAERKEETMNDLALENDLFYLFSGATYQLNDKIDLDLAFSYGNSLEEPIERTFNEGTPDEYTQALSKDYQIYIAAGITRRF